MRAKKSSDFSSSLAGREQTLFSQKVTNSEEAEQIMIKKLNYFRALFEQSFDPYYGTPKWDEKCLEENTILPIEKTSRAYILAMKLNLNDKAEAGFCSVRFGSGQYLLSHVIYYHCIGSEFIQRLTLPVLETDKKMNWVELCN